MNWTSEKPKTGDAIRIKSGRIYHYGIYVSDEEVIQFGTAPQNVMSLNDKEIRVITSSFSDFLQGGDYEVGEPSEDEKKEMFSCGKTVEKARSMIGSGGYNLIHNNCEHFVYLCKFGKPKCSVVDDVRAEMAKAIKIINNKQED